MKTKYLIEGLDCPNCAAKLTRLLEKVDGVTAAKINFLTEEVTVESEETPDFDALLRVVRGFDRSLSFSRK